VSRVLILLGCGPPVILVLALGWALWRIAVHPTSGPDLVIYADGTDTPFAVLRGGARQVREAHPLGDYPSLLIDAVLLMEDRRFFRHRGVDLLAALRAARVNMRHGRIVQGGSTLTQQLSRSRYLGQERTFSRKAREVLLAVVLERILSKEEILERYLNEIYLGQWGMLEVRGMGAASRLYAGKSPRSLSPAEIALLVGLIRSPNNDSPGRSLSRARQRRDLVLRELRKAGRLSDREYYRARGTPLPAPQHPIVEAGHFLDFIRAEVERVRPRSGGAGSLKVFTSLEVEMQRAAHAAVHQGVYRIDRMDGARHARSEPAEAALVALDVETGAIKAMVGGRDYRASQFNRAVQAKRQPGSLFKPFVYLAAFETRRGLDGAMLTPATLVDDGPLPPGGGPAGWAPRNFDGHYLGPVRAREALERSLNAATVRIAEQVGLARVFEQARASGIESALRPGPATVLGASEVSLLEMTAAYATLARGGQWIRPNVIRRIVDGRGRVLFDEEHEAHRVASEQATFLVTSLLQGAVERGTAASVRRLGLTRPAAGKTGTSSHLRDAWFVGYTPDLVAGVWVGTDAGRSLGRTGAQAALPIWTRFVGTALAAAPAREFSMPPGIVRARIDPATGRGLGPGCPGGVEELFIQGTEPPPACPEPTLFVVRWLRQLFSD
jgi:penicillin-binding protein 1B